MLGIASPSNIKNKTPIIVMSNDNQGLEPHIQIKKSIYENTCLFYLYYITIYTLICILKKSSISQDTLQHISPQLMLDS